jgi:hypothetical protein
MTIGAIAVLAALGVRAVSVNRLVRRKLRLSFLLALAYLAGSVALSRAAPRRSPPR